MQASQHNAGFDDRPQPRLSPNLRPKTISLPKNRSTGNLAQDLSGSQQSCSEYDPAGPPNVNPRIRFSMDGGSVKERDALIRSPLVSEPEHGLGISGLSRIRQSGGSRVPSRAPSGTLSRVVTAPPSPEIRHESLSRASSMHMHVSGARGFSVDAATPATQATMGFGEDLQRFPSESLHSFSFAHQSEEALHTRHQVLRKSVEFMRDRAGWTATVHPYLVIAQAKVSGDPEMQSVVSLLSKARLLEGDAANKFGPVTGPMILGGDNIFEKNFVQRSESPESMEDSLKLSPKAELLQPSMPSAPRPDSATSKASSSSQTTGEDKSSRSMTPNSTPNLMSKTQARPPLKRAYTDTKPLSLQTQLADALARPYNAQDPLLDSALLSPTLIPPFAKTTIPPPVAGTTHAVARWSPASQAIFTTTSSDPWTILAANDLACLVFGVTKAEIRRLGIMEVIREDRRQWLKQRLEAPGSEAALKTRSSVASKSRKSSATTSSNLTAGRGGITAMLLSKPSSRQQSSKRAQTEGHPSRSGSRRNSASDPNKPRGVLICGDIVPIQKRNGLTGSASLWVKEKKGYLIWVLEEIIEDCAKLTLDEDGRVLSTSGATKTIWGQDGVPQGKHVSRLMPKIPLLGPSKTKVDYRAITELGAFAARTEVGYSLPVTVNTKSNLGELEVSSFPNIAGILVLSATNMEITSSNSVFASALFGHKKPDGLHITELIPKFVKLLEVLKDEEHLDMVHGIVIPEHSFRRARAHLASREDGANAAEALFLQPTGIPARHRDGSEIYVDVQMRIVKSESSAPEEAIIEEKDEDLEELDSSQLDVVYALWITYSRHLHSVGGGTKTPLISRPPSPPRQPSPGQAMSIVQPPDTTDEVLTGASSPTFQLMQDIQDATNEPISAKPHTQPIVEIKPEAGRQSPSPANTVSKPPHKKAIADFMIIEDMGQGAYGQVKLARYKRPPGTKSVIKYVTKKRILVDTWTRDRKLGTVPSEIHVLNFLRKDGMQHANIVEMTDFFEDNVNYYIEMVPHGLPGMDLFDYIEMRTTMDENEVRNIFVQVVAALHHLHTKAGVVHRDIKDENIVLDGDNKVKLIDFGSAAYIKHGPFDVFVGTIDYAAPEVITGQPYKGKEQDVWALGILLYTLVYKENPFYNVDEILDHELRVPWVMSEGSIDLIRGMLNRNVKERLTIEEVQNHPWIRGMMEEAAESD